MRCIKSYAIPNNDANVIMGTIQFVKRFFGYSSTSVNSLSHQLKEARLFAMNSLEKLKQLTEELPPFPKPVGEIDGFTEYAMTCGKCFGWNLFKSKNVSVDKWFNTKDTVFPKHAHDAKEWIIVYEGSVKIYDDSNVMCELKVGDSWYSNPNTIHRAEFSDDCSYITITVPSAKDFPTVKAIDDERD